MIAWFSQHWLAFAGWIVASVTMVIVAIREWRLRRQVDSIRTEAIIAKAERDDAVLKARDAQIEAQATREQAKAIGRIDKEAKDARVADGGSLADDLAKLNRDARTPPGGTRRP